MIVKRRVTTFAAGPYSCALFVTLLAATASCQSSSGQIPDSLRGQDTTFVQSPRPPVSPRRSEPALSSTGIAPALTSLEDVSGALAGEAGSFAYDFGAYGWPDGWSPYGISPNHVALQFMGIPFDDPVTGRPLLDLLPSALLRPLGLQPARLGAPVGVVAELRSFKGTLTELHFQAGNSGLQRITTLHRQERQLDTAQLAVLFGYEGGAARGEYPGSQLRRRRQILLRTRYRHPSYSLETTLLHNRKRLGAHSGVIPGTPYELIYNRLIATVHHVEAVRQTIRTDVSAVARFRLLSSYSEPFTAQAFLTSHMLKYQRPATDTLRTTVHRLGSRLSQNLSIGRHRIRVLAEAWTDHVTRGSGLPQDLSTTRMSLSVRDSVWYGNLTVVAEGGAYGARAGGFLHMSQQMDVLRLFAEASSTGRAASWVEESGWGDEVRPIARVPDGRISLGRAGLHIAIGSMNLEVFGFAGHMHRPVDLYVQSAGHVAAIASTSGSAAVGLAGDFGFRQNALHGMYLTAQPTVQSAKSTRNQALPRFFVRACLGARYALFKGDLDVDISIRGHYWTEMRSRKLHAPTGLLVLPGNVDSGYPSSGMLPASHTVDLVALAEMRGSHLFVTWENVLSGTTLLAGNQIVPVFPLPARHLRFGVFWPIVN